MSQRWPVRHRPCAAVARSLKLWSFYCDLEESLGTLESARAVYDQILELRIATPQIILNYALFLQVRTMRADFRLPSCCFSYQVAFSHNRKDVALALSLALLSATVGARCMT